MYWEVKGQRLCGMRCPHDLVGKYKLYLCRKLNWGNPVILQFLSLYYKTTAFCVMELHSSSTFCQEIGLIKLQSEEVINILTPAISSSKFTSNIGVNFLSKCKNIFCPSSGALQPINIHISGSARSVDDSMNNGGKGGDKQIVEKFSDS